MPLHDGHACYPGWLRLGVPIAVRVLSEQYLLGKRLSRSCMLSGQQNHCAMEDRGLWSSAPRDHASRQQLSIHVAAQSAEGPSHPVHRTQGTIGPPLAAQDPTLASPEQVCPRACSVRKGALQACELRYRPWWPFRDCGLKLAIRENVSRNRMKAAKSASPSSMATLRRLGTRSGVACELACPHSFIFLRSVQGFRVQGLRP